MFLLLKPKNNQKQVKHNLQEDKIALSIVNNCIRVQKHLSEFLQRRSEMLSLTCKTFVFIIFCLISVCSCLYLIIKNFEFKISQSYSITPIRVPKQVAQNELQKRQPSVGVTKKEFEKIQKFRFYMDSLARSKTGKRIHDSILINRPGLIDSITIIENLYQLHSSYK